MPVGCLGGSDCTCKRMCRQATQGRHNAIWEQGKGVTRELDMWAEFAQESTDGSCAIRQIHSLEHCCRADGLVVATLASSSGSDCELQPAVASSGSHIGSTSDLYAATAAQPPQIRAYLPRYDAWLQMKTTRRYTIQEAVRAGRSNSTHCLVSALAPTAIASSTRATIAAALAIITAFTTAISRKKLCRGLRKLVQRAYRRKLQRSHAAYLARHRGVLAANTSGACCLKGADSAVLPEI